MWLRWGRWRRRRRHHCRRWLLRLLLPLLLPLGQSQGLLTELAPQPLLLALAWARTGMMLPLLVLDMDWGKHWG